MCSCAHILFPFFWEIQSLCVALSHVLNQGKCPLFFLSVSPTPALCSKLSIWTAHRRRSKLNSLFFSSFHFRLTPIISTHSSCTQFSLLALPFFFCITIFLCLSTFSPPLSSFTPERSASNSDFSPLLSFLHTHLLLIFIYCLSLLPLMPLRWGEKKRFLKDTTWWWWKDFPGLGGVEQSNNY